MLTIIFCDKIVEDFVIQMLKWVCLTSGVIPQDFRWWYGMAVLEKRESFIQHQNWQRQQLIGSVVAQISSETIGTFTQENSDEFRCKQNVQVRKYCKTYLEMMLSPIPSVTQARIAKITIKFIAVDVNIFVHTLLWTSTFVSKWRWRVTSTGN